MHALGRSPIHIVKEQSKYPIWIILDQVRSMQNVGSIFRTADCLGISGIYLCGYTPTPPHRDIEKTALGATESVYWKHLTHTQDAIHLLSTQGIDTWIAEQTTESIALQSFKPLFPIAIIFGNEITGVDDSLFPYIKGSIEIPQFGAKHSFNISVSVGIVMWELVKYHLYH